jgi:hypothetical protein
MPGLIVDSQQGQLTCTMNTKLRLPSPTSLTVQLDSLPGGPTWADSCGRALRKATTPAGSRAATLQALGAPAGQQVWGVVGGR